MRKRMIRPLALSLMLAVLFTGTPVFAAEEQAPVPSSPSVEVKLSDAAGKDAGTALLIQSQKGLIVRVEVTGLEPGWHGVHFHGNGDCSDHAEHFKKSGGHAMRDGEKHGLLTDGASHAGDLPNIFADEKGNARAEFFTTNIGFDMLRDKDGGALMIHAAADDHRTDPSGNSGARVSCGVVPAEKTE